MGIDIQSYRSRIGCFRHSMGTDVVTIIVDVNISEPAKYGGLIAILACLLLIVKSFYPSSNFQEYTQDPELGFTEAIILFTGILTNQCCRGIVRAVFNKGAVAFIRMLLLLAGIEPNPGPLRKNDDQASTSKGDENGGTRAKEISPGSVPKEEQQQFDIDQMDVYNKTLLDILGLTQFYPSKLTFNDIMAVEISNSSTDLATDKLPIEMLKGFIMVNCKVRDTLPKAVFQTTSDDDDDDDDDDDSIQYSTLDIFMTIFNCCNSFLKQIVVGKMFMCKLAVPIMYQSLHTEQFCFSAWPLRSIMFELGGSESLEKPLMKHQMKIVSFIRVDRPHFSKSKMINEILSDESHKTFYHKDCPLGMIKRVIANGVTEASWYLPSGKSTDIFHDVCMFLNLRGDARQFIQQRRVIETISNVIIFIIDVESVEQNSDLIESMKLENSSKILFLTCKPMSIGNTKEHASVVKYCNTHFSNILIMKTFQKGNEKNLYDIKTNLIKNISQLCSNCEGITIEDCADIATKQGVFSDEETKLCKEGKELAGSVFIHIGKIAETSKESLLPLQGKLWKQWSEEKRRTKTPKETVYDSDHSLKIMANIRKQQANKSKQLTPFMQKFLEIILQYSRNKNDELMLFFLQWLKFFLDERSRAVIPKLMRDYNNCWTALKNAKETNEQSHLKTGLEKAKEAREDAVLGFEHIIREIGQLYEAIKENPMSNEFNEKEIMEDLPCAISNLLQLGYPFELMDGDVANVPSNWIEAVFNSLEKTIKDKKVFVLSVLGIQSSGKSTLLNTMFGLQFAVSAGRCTKGIYAQLIPVKQNQNFIFDYILVLDAEGIRSEKVGIQNHNHDNELTTFLLGMGDMTIVNIKGENINEMQDVLQIAVHASLRLKIAKGGLNLHQSCIFVHQNVAAVNAETKLQESKQILVQNLDDMTVLAAEQENASNITAFSNIIEFDSTKNVWYFPDLWHGDPPMAYANPGYSENVLKVKNALLEHIKAKKAAFLSITELCQRINDLWNGILADNFVFSFRNSIELKVYNAMEVEYQKLTWDLQKSASTSLIKIKSEINGTETPAEINEQILNFKKNFLKEENKIKSKLAEYFNTNHKDILIQWKEGRLALMKEYADNIVRNSQKEINNTHCQKKVTLKTQVENTEFEKAITTKAKALAMEFKGNIPEQKTLENQFNDMWETWTMDISTTAVENTIDVEKEIEKNLLETFKSMKTNLSMDLKKKPVHSFQFSDKLASFEPLEVDENHISIKKVLPVIGQIVQKSPPTFLECKAKVCKLTHDIFTEIDNDMEVICQTDTKFEEVHLAEIFQKVSKKIDDHNKSTEDFKIQNPFKSSLLVHVGHFVACKFEMLNKIYDQKNSPKAQIEKFKNTTWNLFLNLVSQKSHEAIVANIFCDSVQMFINKELNKYVTLEIVEEILEVFGHTKNGFIYVMLDKLATNKKFDQFMNYIKNPKSYALTQITTLVATLPWTRRHGKTIYAIKAEEFIRKIYNDIDKQLDQISKKHGKTLVNDFETFILHLNQNCKIFNIAEDVVQQRGQFEIHSFDDFLKTTLDLLSQTKEELLNSYAAKTDVTWEKPIHDLVMERIWGCCETCPFCCEPCRYTNHTENTFHSCVQHRPKGINGIINTFDQKLVTASCSFSVQSTQTFKCSACYEKCRSSEKCEKLETTTHDYQSYKDFFPSWVIEDCSDQSSSKYWNWFMANHIKDLVKFYAAEMPLIPENWNDISDTDAKTSLGKVYIPEGFGNK